MVGYPNGSMKTFKEFMSESASAFATKAHTGQSRAGGLPYIVHPAAVAKSVELYKGNSKNIKALKDAAWLHDTVEDTDTKLSDIENEFGTLVASLVAELTSNKEEIDKHGKKDYLANKMGSMSSYGLVIKLADRLDNVKDIANAKTPEWRKKYKEETEYILKHIESIRQLSATHKKIIVDIRNKINSV